MSSISLPTSHTPPGTTVARLFGPLQPDESGVVVYETPEGAETVLTRIDAANTSDDPATVTVGVGGIAAANQVVPGVTVPPHDVRTFDVLVSLAAGETIVAAQATSGAVTVTGSGHTTR